MDVPPKQPLLLGPRFMAAGLILSMVAAVGGLFSLLSVSVQKVRDGKGFETFKTFWLVDFSYIGALVLFVFVCAVFVFGAMSWWREEKEWRQLERKYEVREKE